MGYYMLMLNNCRFNNINFRKKGHDMTRVNRDLMINMNSRRLTHYRQTTPSTTNTHPNPPLPAVRPSASSSVQQHTSPPTFNNRAPHPIQFSAATHLTTTNRAPHPIQFSAATHLTTTNRAPHPVQCSNTPHHQQSCTPPHPVQCSNTPHHHQSCTPPHPVQ